MGDVSDQANAIIPDYNLLLLGQMIDTAVLLGLIRKNTQKFRRGTQSQIFGAEFDYAEGHAFLGTNDAASVPISSDASVVQSTVTPKIQYMSFHIYPASEAKFQSGKAFITNLLAWKVTNTQKAALMRMNQDALGTGKGVRALVNGDPGTGTTVTIDSPFGLAATGADVGANPSYLFGKNMRIDFVNPADGTSRAGTPTGGYQITGINKSTQVLTVNATDPIDGSVADNDWIVRFGENSSATAGNGLQGLLRLVGGTEVATTVQGISGSTYPDWQSTRKTNSGNLRSLTEALLNSAITNVLTDTGISGGGPEYLLFSRPEGVDRFVQLTSAAQRLGSREAVGGSDEPTFFYRGAKWKFLSDPHAMTNRIWGLHMPDFSMAELQPLQWYRMGGSYLTPVASAQTSAFLFRGVGFGWADMCIKHRNRQFVIEDILFA